MRESDSELLEYWLTEARKRLATSADVILSQLTDNDFHVFEIVKRVCLQPASVEESMARGELFDVFREVVRRAVARATAADPKDAWTPWTGMDIAEAHRLIEMLNEGDPLAALAARVQLAEVCRRMGESLEELSEIGFPTRLPQHRRRLAA